MLSLDDGHSPLPRELLDAHGGFAWWYLDWIGEDGTSVVLIPSFGLPFLPGYASAARSGQAPAAGQLPSLHVAVTRRDRPDLYLLQRYAPTDAGWGPDGMRLGDSHFQSELSDGVRRFTASLDCPLPGTTDRLTGTVHFEAPAIHVGEDRVEPGPHRWTPLGIGPATVDLRVGDAVLASGRGRAYHDRNGCPKPLQDLGIDHWVWGRSAYPDGELIHYLLWPEDGGAPRAIALFVHLDGRVEHLDASLSRSGWRVARFGMPWWRTIDLERDGAPFAQIRVRSIVDDGPFYLRFHTEVQRGDQVAHGVGEAVRPERVDHALTRPFVRMAVHDLAGPNSMWLPLFVGRREDRFARLLRGPRSLALEGTAP